MVFDDPGVGNYTLALMAGRVSTMHRAPMSDPSLIVFPSIASVELVNWKIKLAQSQNQNKSKNWALLYF